MTEITNKKNIIKLIKNLDLEDLINFNLIKNNSKYLSNEGQKIQKIWNNLSDNYNEELLNENNNEFNIIYNIVKNGQLTNYNEFSNYLKNNKSITKYSDENNKLKFYVIKKDLSNSDKERILHLIKINISMKKYFNDYADTVIIWIPINKGRDFNENSINSYTLSNSRNKFEAFTASGLTFSGSINNNNERYTIITRYEEIEKLLIHELAHNYGIDGSLSHNHEFKEFNNKYTTTKNELLNNNNNKNYDYKFSIYESYAELLSSYFNLIFMNINSYNKNDLYSKLVIGTLVEMIYAYNTICNLAKLNGYKNYNEFIKDKVFQGEICFFEYYYLKALMYNNYEFKVLQNKEDDPKKLYEQVLPLINKNDELLEKIYEENAGQNNFKFCYY